MFQFSESSNGVINLSGGFYLKAVSSRFTLEGRFRESGRFGVVWLWHDDNGPCIAALSFLKQKGSPFPLPNKAHPHNRVRTLPRWFTDNFERCQSVGEDTTIDEALVNLPSHAPMAYRDALKKQFETNTDGLKRPIPYRLIESTPHREFVRRVSVALRHDGLIKVWARDAIRFDFLYHNHSAPVSIVRSGRDIITQADMLTENHYRDALLVKGEENLLVTMLERAIEELRADNRPDDVTLIMELESDLKRVRHWAAGLPV